MQLAERTAQARLTAEQSQQVFRTLLTALARPGLIGALPMSADRRVPPALLPVLALADVEVGVCVLDVADDPWEPVVLRLTGAPRESLTEAALVTAMRPPTADDVRSLVRGTLLAPENGCRLVIACRSLDLGQRHPGRADPAGGPLTTVVVSGPGVTTSRTFVAGGIGADVFDALARANGDFPIGIDTWLVADNGHTVGLPRSAAVRLGEGTWATQPLAEG